MQMQTWKADMPKFPFRTAPPRHGPNHEIKKKKKSSSIVNLLKNKKKGVKFFQIYKFILQI